MKYNLIWDLDGTIFDSYPVILKTLQTLYEKYDVTYNYDDVYKYIIKNSVTSLIGNLCNELNIDYADLKNEFSEQLRIKNHDIKLMDNVVDILNNDKTRNFVITNKGNNALVLLDYFEIRSHFVEIITSSDNFNKKPDTQSINYLINKYNLDKNYTYYIGDRPVDYELALNAKVMSINFHVESNACNFNINNLNDIKTILKI